MAGTINGDSNPPFTLGATRSPDWPLISLSTLLRAVYLPMLTCMNVESLNTVPCGRAQGLSQSRAFASVWSGLVNARTSGGWSVAALFPHLEYRGSLIFSTPLPIFAPFQLVRYTGTQNQLCHFRACSPLRAPHSLWIHVSSLGCHVSPGSIWALPSSPVSFSLLLIPTHKSLPTSNDL